MDSSEQELIDTVLQEEKELQAAIGDLYSRNFYDCKTVNYDASDSQTLAEGVAQEAANYDGLIVSPQVLVAIWTFGEFDIKSADTADLSTADRFYVGQLDQHIPVYVDPFK